MLVISYKANNITLMSQDYDSFAMTVLSQNHREINIAESILANIKVVITCTKGFSNNDIMGIAMM